METSEQRRRSTRLSTTHSIGRFREFSSDDDEGIEMVHLGNSTSTSVQPKKRGRKSKPSLVPFEDDKHMSKQHLGSTAANGVQTKKRGRTDKARPIGSISTNNAPKKRGRPLKVRPIEVVEGPVDEDVVTLLEDVALRPGHAVGAAKEIVTMVEEVSTPIEMAPGEEQQLSGLPIDDGMVNLGIATSTTANNVQPKKRGRTPKPRPIGSTSTNIEPKMTSFPSKRRPVEVIDKSVGEVVFMPLEDVVKTVEEVAKPVQLLGLPLTNFDQETGAPSNLIDYGSVPESSKEKDKSVKEHSTNNADPQVTEASEPPQLHQRSSSQGTLENLQSDEGFRDTRENILAKQGGGNNKNIGENGPALVSSSKLPVNVDEEENDDGYFNTSGNYFTKMTLKCSEPRLNTDMFGQHTQGSQMVGTPCQPQRGYLVESLGAYTGPPISRIVQGNNTTTGTISIYPSALNLGVRHQDSSVMPSQPTTVHQNHLFPPNRENQYNLLSSQPFERENQTKFLIGGSSSHTASSLQEQPVHGQGVGWNRPSLGALPSLYNRGRNMQTSVMQDSSRLLAFSSQAGGQAMLGGNQNQSIPYSHSSVGFKQNEIGRVYQGQENSRWRGGFHDRTPWRVANQVGPTYEMSMEQLRDLHPLTQLPPQLPLQQPQRLQSQPVLPLQRPMHPELQTQSQPFYFLKPPTQPHFQLQLQPPMQPLGHLQPLMNLQSQSLSQSQLQPLFPMQPQLELQHSQPHLQSQPQFNQHRN